MIGDGVHLRTFAAGKKCWNRAGKRLLGQSLSFDSIQSRIAFNAADLTHLLGEQAKGVLELSKLHKRGFGLWAWKIPLLLSQLRAIPRGETLLFLDAGSSLNSSQVSLKRFREYVSISKTYGSLFFQQALIESQWTKKELRATFGDIQHWNSGQLLGGIHFLTSYPATIQMIAEADEIARASGYLALQDAQPGSDQLESFVAHRNDQSVLSLTAKRHGAIAIPDETYFAPHWTRDGLDFPIWASRLCSGNPNLDHSLVSRIRRESERRLPF